jgi:prolipoprotein diacylglyceryltransferase
MTNLLFVGSMALVLSATYAWGFRVLSRERWQILGTIPVRKQVDGSWQGLNLTYYGLINACSVTAAALLVLVLLGAVGLPLEMTLAIAFGLLLILAPMAKLIARWVEKKKHTFSIGGAAFAGLLLSPPLLWLLRSLPVRYGYPQLPVMAICSATAVAYALGEGSGRLACISFGCCYGKPLENLPVRLQPWLAPFCIVYEGATKKADYADGLGGRKTIAVQAITAVLYSTAALAGIYLFLDGHTPAAYLLCVATTQLWRFVSEFLRADYRGAGRISAYQYMALVATAAALVYFQWLYGTPMSADITKGLRAIWNPLIILTCQFTWTAVFIYMGRSHVTAAHIRLFVRSDRI